MSNRAMSWAIEVRCLPIATKAVLMLLADCHNGSTGQCHPSMEWLADRTGLKVRALQLHLKAIEDAGLMIREYDYHGRGKGCSVAQFSLKIGITGAVKKPAMDTQDIADAKYCARKITSMGTQNIALSYKEEPEENRKSKGLNDLSPDFEQAWKVYQGCSLKAVKQTKKLAKAQWAKAVKRAGGAEPILKALERDVDRRRNPEGFMPALPDMFRWLKDDCWSDVLEQMAPSAPAEMTTEGWQRAMRHWVDTGEWLADHASLPPNDPGCSAPANMIRHALKLRPERSAA